MQRRWSWLVADLAALAVILFAGWWQRQVRFEQRLTTLEALTDTLPEEAHSVFRSLRARFVQ